jgi:hypothetical protein
MVGDASFSANTVFEAENGCEKEPIGINTRTK